jgi:hypothetical protein
MGMGSCGAALFVYIGVKMLGTFYFMLFKQETSMNKGFKIFVRGRLYIFVKNYLKL